MALLLETPPVARAPAVRPARPVPDRAPSRVVHRMRLLAVCLGFVALALWQQPGRIVPDTKLDLFVDPLAFLGRALRLWEPEGFSGQVQNQAYGYLFPMGPFFALGDLLGAPVWVVQRLWWATLLSAAFLGVVVLAGQLRVGTPATRIVAGVAYALAPRMVSSLGAVSIEVLPMALAPWVLVPLVVGSRGGSPRRAGAAGGLVVFCVGGVNAAATAAVLPLGALWLLTRAPGPRRRRLMVWWTACTALATAWWVGPLLLLGRYSPPFLDHIETASTTTAPGELAQALRGMTQWVAWLGTPAGPTWPAGSALLHEALPVLASVLLAALGLAALTRADLPHRRWLVLGALTGLVLLTAGHLAAGGAVFDGLAAGPLRAALDGALAPLRNVHKFDPVLRLPLAIGLAHVLGVALRAARRGAGARARVAAAVPVVAVLAVLGVATPALDGRLAASGSYLEVPDYWRQTADALAALDPAGRALLLPGSSFGVYLWGSPADEPLQPLAGSPWTVRNAVPLTPAGYIRMLDVVEDRLARGEGGAGLTSYLARAGISHLVVRNDLDAGSAGSTRTALVRRALADSPGLTRVGAFGPPVDTGTAFPGIVLDAALATPAPAVEVFAVADPAPRASLTPLPGVRPVLGGPDAVGALADRDPWNGAPTIAAGDPAVATDAPVVVSDALVRRERTFGRIADAAGAALAPGDPLRLDAPARDYLLPDQPAQESSVRYTGGVPGASSSASDPDSIGGARVAHQPYAALDGDPGTAWRPAVLLGGDPQWWEVTLDAPVSAAAVTVTLDPGTVPSTPSRVRVRTDAGEHVVPLQRTAEPQRLALPPGPTRTLRITADPSPGTFGGPRIGLAEVALPGAVVRRTLVTPVPDRRVSTYAFDTTPARSGCVTSTAGPVRCAPALVRGAEEPLGLDRAFTVAVPAEYEVAVTAVPRPGPALDALLAPPPV
uniref:alpha-(1->3)-arabinofuranosyltransferase domain-containing protein n=1 Tax=Pseudonocardia lacus TaxID=2835865 RepID=UPI001BDD61A7